MMNSEVNDETTAEGSTREKRADVIISCLVLRNVTPYTTTAPVKLRTQTVIY